MKYAHLARLTVFSYEHEDSEPILNAFLDFFPFNLEENKVELKKRTAAGFNEKNITIFEATIEKNSLISKFLENLFKKLDESQKNMILEQAESRLDANLDFFLRFGKDEWLNGRKLLLTDSGNCFHLKISMAAFPKKREIALNLVSNLISNKNFNKN
ncbi:hypothetical protein HYX08_01030 [Candidatus Woesearchaeota archaeon]|nr:hypothetical protein [Candidatus Woesearchaeota archaeon]